jgi:hypothetical protein
MAIDLGALALQIGGDFTVNDNKKQQEQLEERFKELQDNKQLYRALATARYSKDMERYYKKVEANDKIESAYAKIEKENMTPEKAAYEIVMATPSLKDSWVSAGSGEHGEKRRNQILKDVRANFKHKEANIEIGVDAPAQTKKWYEFSRPEMELTAPKQEDYFQDPKYWGDLAKEIRAKETGPLQKQILKMLGKEPAEVDLDTLEQKAGTDIEEMLPKPKIHKSTGIGRDEDEDADGFADFVADNEAWVKQYNKLNSEIKWKSLNKNDHFLSWMKTNNLLGTATESSFELSQNDTVIKGITPAAQAMLSTYKNIYEEVVKAISAKNLAMDGVDITQLNDYVDIGEVNKAVQRLMETRAIKSTITEGADVDFVSFVPLSIAGADGIYTVGKSGGEYEGENYNLFATADSTIPQIYHNWLKVEAEKIKHKFEKWGVDPQNAVGAAMFEIQNSIQIGGKYAQQFRNHLDGVIKKHENDKKKEEGGGPKDGETILGGDLKIYDVVPATQDGKEGYSDGTEFQSWAYVHEKGLIEKILEDYPHLEKSYNEWKATQSNANNTTDENTITVKGQEIKTSGSTDEKEEVIIPTDNNEETISSGVGNEPWLYSDGTFNPDYDPGKNYENLDGGPYTVGTKANDYIKAKNSYDREQRKSSSILNKFFN